MTTIAPTEAREILAADFIDYTFTLPARTCSVDGRIEGITGGVKDFEALIVTDDGFKNWAAGVETEGIQSGRKVVWSFATKLIGPGRWHLVVSNKFSLVTKKAVTVSATATCPQG